MICAWKLSRATFVLKMFNTKHFHQSSCIARLCFLWPEDRFIRCRASVNMWAWNWMKLYLSVILVDWKDLHLAQSGTCTSLGLLINWGCSVTHFSKVTHQYGVSKTLVREMMLSLCVAYPGGHPVSSSNIISSRMVIYKPIGDPQPTNLF